VESCGLFLRRAILMDRLDYLAVFYLIFGIIVLVLVEGWV
jgi:hypothetical protein